MSYQYNFHNQGYQNNIQQWDEYQNLPVFSLQEPTNHAMEVNNEDRQIKTTYDTWRIFPTIIMTGDNIFPSIFGGYNFGISCVRSTSSSKRPWYLLLFGSKKKHSAFFINFFISFAINMLLMYVNYKAYKEMNDTSYYSSEYSSYYSEPLLKFDLNFILIAKVLNITYIILLIFILIHIWWHIIHKKKLHALFFEVSDANKLNGAGNKFFRIRAEVEEVCGVTIYRSRLRHYPARRAEIQIMLHTRKWMNCYWYFPIYSFHLEAIIWIVGFFSLFITYPYNYIAIYIWLVWFGLV